MSFFFSHSTNTFRFALIGHHCHFGTITMESTISGFFPSYSVNIAANESTLYIERITLVINIEGDISRGRRGLTYIRYKNHTVLIQFNRDNIVLIFNINNINVLLNAILFK